MIQLIQQKFPGIKFKKGEEDITSHSGLVVIGRILREIIPSQWLKERLSYRGINGGYWGEEIVEPVILMLCGGGNRLEDIKSDKRRPGIEESNGMEEGTFCRHHREVVEEGGERRWGESFREDKSKDNSADG